MPSLSSSPVCMKLQPGAIEEHETLILFDRDRGVFNALVDSPPSERLRRASSDV